MRQFAQGWIIFLVSAKWGEQFPDLYLFQRRLPRLPSDRFRICLETSKLERGKAFFRFESMWLMDSVTLSKSGRGARVNGFASYVVIRTLKYIKDKLKIWNKDFLGILGLKSMFP